MRRNPGPWPEMPTKGAIEHDPVNPVGQSRGVGQGDQSAHGMGQQEKWQFRVGQHDLLEKGLQVALMIVEMPQMAAARIGKQSRRSALAAPVESRDPKSHGIEIANGLEIFFDAFIAALVNYHRAARHSLARAKNRIAQIQPVVALERAGDMVIRDRIVWAGVKHEVHDLECRSVWN